MICRLFCACFPLRTTKKGAFFEGRKGNWFYRSFYFKANITNPMGIKSHSSSALANDILRDL